MIDANLRAYYDTRPDYDAMLPTPVREFTQRRQDLWTVGRVLMVLLTEDGGPGGA